jgi:hypothetical protein
MLKVAAFDESLKAVGEKERLHVIEEAASPVDEGCGVAVAREHRRERVAPLALPAGEHCVTR